MSGRGAGERSGPLGWRLKTQLTAFLVVVFIVMMSTVGVVTYRVVARVMRRQSADITSRSLTQGGYNILGEIEAGDTAARMVVTFPEIGEYLDNGWREDYTSMALAGSAMGQLRQVMQTYAPVHSIYLWGESGSLLGVTSRSQIVSAESYRPRRILPEQVTRRMAEMVEAGEFTAYLGGLPATEFAGTYPSSTEPESAPRYITVITRFYTSGVQNAFVVVNLDQQSLADTFSRYGEESGEVTLVDGGGAIISHSDPARIGQILGYDLTGAVEESGSFMEGGAQINYHRIAPMGWHLVGEVPQEVLYRDLDAVRQLFFTAILAVLVVALLISNYWIRRVTRPLDTLRAAMHRMEEGEVGGQLQGDDRGELGMLGAQFNSMSRSIRDLIARIKESEAERRVLEMEALRAQINPHFLYNTLSNIRFMAVIEGQQRLADCIMALGGLLQPLYKSEGDFWPIAQEAAALQNYVAVMNYRFGGRIRVEYNLPDSLADTPILKFILQPLVENAITHSALPETEALCICVGFAAQGGEIAATVADNGGGIAPGRLRELRELLERPARGGSGRVGLENVHRRIRTCYGAPYGLHMESTGQGARVRLVYPLPPAGS